MPVAFFNRGRLWLPLLILCLAASFVGLYYFRHFAFRLPYYLLGLRFQIDQTFRDTAGRVEAPCSDPNNSSSAAVLLILGQSNAANSSSPDGLFIPRAGVYNFNFLDG